MVDQLHHIGIIVPKERNAKAFMDLFGLRETCRGFVETWSALCIFAEGLGPVPLEFIVPDGPPLDGFNKGAGGVHHIAIAVADIADASRKLGDKGIGMLEDAPVHGAGAFLCNFIQPVYTRGILVELVQPL